MKRTLFKKGQSYSDLPVSRPVLVHNTIDRTASPTTTTIDNNAPPGKDDEEEIKSAPGDGTKSDLKLKQSVAFASGLPTTSSKEKINLEGLMMSPRGTPDEDLARLTGSSGDAKLARLGGSSGSGKKKKEKEKEKGSTRKERKAKSLRDSGSKRLERKVAAKKNEKGDATSATTSPCTVPKVGKYIPPPPSAPPEWAKELPTPMEQDRFVLNISPDDKHLLKSGLKDLEEKKKKSKSAGLTKAHSSHNVKQHYMPPIVMAAGGGGTKPMSPRRRPPEDIRISAPRNFRNLKVGGLFGVLLESAMRGYPEWQVPPFLELLCMHIEHHFLGLEGIFRMAGNVDETKLYRDMVNNGEQVDLFKASNGYVVCDLLKIYFREYPDSIIPSSLFSSFVELARKASPSTAPQELQVLFKEVPQFNKFTLKRILMCLSKVAEMSTENKMDATNLATIFGASFFRPPPSAVTTDKAAIEKQMAEAKLINELAVTLINHHDIILKEVEYKPYYKYYARVTKPYKPRTAEDLELVAEDQVVVITGTAKGTLFMGETREAAGFFPMANVALLNGETAASIEEEEVKLRPRSAVRGSRPDPVALPEAADNDKKGGDGDGQQPEKQQPEVARVDIQARVEQFGGGDSSPAYLSRARASPELLKDPKAKRV